MSVTDKVELDEVEIGGRPVQLGQLVHVKPSRPGKRDGFDAVVRRITDTPGGIEVEVVGSPPGKANAIRTFLPDRLRRCAQPRGVNTR